MWSIREEIALALVHEGVTYKVSITVSSKNNHAQYLCVQYDISLPQEEMYKFVEEMRERCGAAALTTVGYGHLGDGNLHLNIIGSAHSAELLSLIEPYVFERTGIRLCECLLSAIVALLLYS